MHYQQYECPFYNNSSLGYRKDMSTQATAAMANIVGGPLAPNIRGTIQFTEVTGGTEISVEVFGLPPYTPSANGKPPIGPHGFHIHDGRTCVAGNPAEPFMLAGDHWNPTNQPHGNHAGDFPVLFSNNGYSKMTFFTNKFNVPQIIGKTIIIHESPDDYRTQPAGAAGRKLACGVIQWAV